MGADTGEVPRRNRPPQAAPAAPLGEPRPLLCGALGWARMEAASDGEWMVRTVPGTGGRKVYRCPGCDHEIAPGVGHVVAWPVDTEGDESADQRRHWHSPCWAARQRRTPGRRPGR